MKKLSQVDLDRLLNEPIYSWQTRSLLGGVVDFLVFSERNLSWIRRREIRAAEQEGNLVEFAPPDEYLAESYREQLVESAKYRFDVGLSQSVRYSGLVAFITAIEFCAKVFAKRCSRAAPNPPNGENKHIYFLSMLNEWSDSEFDNAIEDLKKLVYLRNCIVHTAGFVEGYKFEAGVRKAVALLSGFHIWKEDFLGTSISIDEGAVECYANSAINWLPKLDERCTSMDILR